MAPSTKSLKVNAEKVGTPNKSKERRSSSLSSIDLDSEQTETPIRSKKPTKKQKTNPDVFSSRQTKLMAWKQLFEKQDSEAPKLQTTQDADTDSESVKYDDTDTPTTHRTESDKFDIILTRMDLITQQLKDVVKIQDLDARLELATRPLKEDNEIIRSELFDIKNENDKLREMVLSLEQRVNANTENIGLAHQKVDFTKDTLDDLEQHGRLNTVRIYGLKDAHKFEDVETSRELALELINDKLGIEIDESDIDVAHRLGRWLPTQPRGVIVKFVRRSIKMEVMRNSNKLRDTQFNIKEDVSGTNRDLMNKLRLREDTKSVWSSNGKIYAEMNNKTVRKFESDLKTRLMNQQKSQNATSTTQPGHQNTNINNNGFRANFSPFMRPPIPMMNMQARPRAPNFNNPNVRPSYR